MSIHQYLCPRCGLALQASQDLSGRAVKCNDCKSIFTAPRIERTESPPPLQTSQVSSRKQSKETAASPAQDDGRSSREDAEGPKKRSPTRRRKFVRLAFCAIVVGAVVGVVFGFRAYKHYRIRQERDRFINWVTGPVYKNNPVGVERAYGIGGPDWMGYTSTNVELITQAGAYVTIECLIESSLTDTKFVRIEVMYSLPEPPIPLGVDWAEEVAKRYATPKARTGVKLPLDVVDQGVPIDLRTIHPEAFPRPRQPKSEAPEKP
jgi:DNA-directed RNA polymerase subunit RPC12/RpoP